jgi:teichuronic acid biosynthesis protein TuaE
MKNIEIQNRIFRILSIVFIVEIIFSLLEAFTSFRLPISPFSNYIIYFGRNVDLSELSENVMSYILQSPTGFQWNPNNLAITFLIIYPFFLLYKDKLIKFLGISSILVLIIMCGSRGVFIAFSFMVFVYMFFLSKKKFLIYFSVLPLSIILFIISFDNLKNSENDRIREIATAFDALSRYIFENNINNNDSVGVRQQLIQNGLNALKESNYLGVGGGGSVAVQENLGGVAGKFTSMHNFWVEIFVDSGIIFTSIFVIWYIYILLKLYIIGIYTKNYTYRYYTQSLFLSMISFLVGAISGSSVIYLFPMWIMFGFAISTINNYKRYKNETLDSFRS